MSLALNSKQYQLSEVKIKVACKCPGCKQTLTDRLPRPYFIKKAMPNAPISSYICYKCLRTFIVWKSTRFAIIIGNPFYRTYWAYITNNVNNQHSFLR